jgi:hypothetical protein
MHRGTIVYANGDRYEGQLKDGIPHGQGTLVYANGDRYEGEWQDDKRHGQGTYTHSSGAKYEGQWKGGKKHGEGTYKYSDGNRYEGQLKDGVPHGQGILVYANGDRYEGEWQGGKKHGEGTYTSPSGDIICKAIYKDDYLETLQLITIKENEKTHCFEYEEDKLYYWSGQDKESKKEVDLKENKRILAVLKQFGGATANQEPHSDSYIEVQKAESFAAEIKKLKQKSESNKSTIIKKFETPTHAFVMIFENGKAYCLDNGGLSAECNKEYKNKLTVGDEYHILNFDHELNVKIGDNEISINIHRKDFVCRHKATVIYEKAKELLEKRISTKKSLAQEIIEHYKPSSLLRINSFNSLNQEDKKPSDSCSVL